MDQRLPRRLFSLLRTWSWLTVTTNVAYRFLFSSLCTYNLKKDSSCTAELVSTQQRLGPLRKWPSSPPFRSAIDNSVKRPGERRIALLQAALSNEVSIEHIMPMDLRKQAGKARDVTNCQRLFFSVELISTSMGDVNQMCRKAFMATYKQYYTSLKKQAYADICLSPQEKGIRDVPQHPYSVTIFHSPRAWNRRRDNFFWAGM